MQEFFQNSHFNPFKNDALVGYGLGFLPPTTCNLLPSLYHLLSWQARSDTMLIFHDMLELMILFNFFNINPWIYMWYEAYNKSITYRSMPRRAKHKRHQNLRWGTHKGRKPNKRSFLNNLFQAKIQKLSSRVIHKIYIHQRSKMKL